MKYQQFSINYLTVNNGRVKCRKMSGWFVLPYL